MNFAQIVRSPQSVRHAFDGSPVHAAWWRVILLLHGKPAPIDLATENANVILANGFRFYGYLYGIMALVLLVLSPLVSFAVSESSHFWALLSLLSATYLGCTTQLAFVGARRLLSQSGDAIPLLVTFFVSLISWLTAFLSGSLIAVHFLTPEAELISMLAIGLVIVFGVGSYFIELMYLITQYKAAH